ncbi:MAG TPA: hypothetical protein VHB73_00955 [Alphaproteobacteria bacterium]|nr:hypothetical protein [Alphaproteobacteria bacterium]
MTDNKQMPFKLPVSVLNAAPHAMIIQDADLKDLLMVYRGGVHGENVAKFVVDAINAYNVPAPPSARELAVEIESLFSGVYDDSSNCQVDEQKWQLAFGKMEALITAFAAAQSDSRLALAREALKVAADRAQVQGDADDILLFKEALAHLSAPVGQAEKPRLYVAGGKHSDKETIACMTEVLDDIAETLGTPKGDVEALMDKLENAVAPQPQGQGVWVPKVPSGADLQRVMNLTGHTAMHLIAMWNTFIEPYAAAPQAQPPERKG